MFSSPHVATQKAERKPYLPPAVLAYVAGLPKAARLVKFVLIHWSEWLACRHYGSLESAHGYRVWAAFLADHTVMYTTGERGDLPLEEELETVLYEKAGKQKGPMCLNEAKWRISILVKWQSHNNWNREEDMAKLSDLYHRFSENLQNPTPQLTGLPNAVRLTKMLDSCAGSSQGQRDGALIALAWALNCTPDDLGRIECRDVLTDDWQTWSIRLSSVTHSDPVILDLETTYYLIHWLLLRRWRPGLEKKLFLQSNMVDELSPTAIQLMLERRFRISRVIDPLPADSHSDDGTYIPRRYGERYLEWMKQRISKIADRVKFSADRIEQRVKRSAEAESERLHREAERLKHEAEREFRLAELRRATDAWAKKPTVGWRGIGINNTSSPLTPKRRGGHLAATTLRGTEHASATPTSLATSPTEYASKMHNDPALLDHYEDWDAAIHQGLWRGVDNQHRDHDRLREEDNEQIDWDDTVINGI